MVNFGVPGQEEGPDLKRQQVVGRAIDPGNHGEFLFSYRRESFRVRLSAVDFEQGFFNFESKGSDEGYRNWQKELGRRKKAFESRYGIILGSAVRLALVGEDQLLEGVITLCESKDPKNRSRLRLRLGKREFTLAQIESISRIL